MNENDLLNLIRSSNDRDATLQFALETALALLAEQTIEEPPQMREP